MYNITTKPRLSGKLNNKEIIIKEYPELEDLEIKSDIQDQKFKSFNKYGFNEVFVHKIQTEELTITPTTEQQIKTGLYNKVVVDKIQSEKLNIIPTAEKQTYTGLYHQVEVEGFETDTELETSFASLIGEDLGANITKLPKGITKLRDSAFIYCTNLKKIELYEEITEIGANTFADCPNLEEVIIKGNFNKTNRMAFGRCSKLTKIVFLNITKVPSLGLYTFLNTPIESGTGFIYVPDTLVDTFKANSSWSSYQIKPISELE